jgi:DNA-binding transcriptional regulator GbsR (MarR family)
MKSADIFVENIIKSASEFADSIGVGTVVAQIYALLYVSLDVLSLDEISEKLKISKSTVSQNIRILESWDAVKNTFVKGSRKDYYEVNPSIIEIILRRLKNGLSTRLAKVGADVNEIESLITNVRNENKKTFYRKRVSHIKNEYQKILTLVNMLPDKM